jgi:anti-sigma-K factor RskA
MEHKLATDQVKEQAALYALGALSQIEARAFENHIADGCEVCQAEVAGFDGVVGLLGLAAPPVSPPPHLRETLTAMIAKEPRTIGFDLGAAGRAHPQWGARRERRSLWTALPWAVAACLAVVAVISVLSVRRVISKTDQEIARMRLDFLHLTEVLVQARQRDAEYVQVISALSKPGATHITLAAKTETHPNSKAFIAWDREANRWYVTADMAPAPAGKVYQLWFLTGGAAPKSAGLISTTAGHGYAEVDVPTDIGKINAAAITLEPEGGSATPTMPIYVGGQAD